MIRHEFDWNITGSIPRVRITPKREVETVNMATENQSDELVFIFVFRSFVLFLCRGVVTTMIAKQWGSGLYFSNLAKKPFFKSNL